MHKVAFLFDLYDKLMSISYVIEKDAKVLHTLLVLILEGHRYKEWVQELLSATNELILDHITFASEVVKDSKRQHVLDSVIVSVSRHLTLKL